jgi:hypothetical protein
MPRGKVLMGLGSFGQWKSLRYGDLELRRAHRAVETFEFPDTGHTIIGNEFEAAPFLWYGLDAVGIGNPPDAPPRG